MARVTVQQSCGHYARITVEGTEDNRQAKIRETERSACFDCYRDQRTAQAIAETADLPALHGTPRQCEWASVIRRDKLAQLDAKASPILAELRQMLTRPNLSADRLAQHTSEVADLVGAVSWCKRQVSASFWIERRDLDGLHFLQAGLHATIGATVGQEAWDRWQSRLRLIGATS